MKIQILAEIVDDVIHWVNEEKADVLIKNIPNGRLIITLQTVNPQADVAEYRAVYFAKIDFLCKEVGEKRYDMHDLVKEYVIFPMMEQLPDLFSNTEVISTKHLSVDGWPNLIERLELWTFITYNIILP